MAQIDNWNHFLGSGTATRNVSGKLSRIFTDRQVIMKVIKQVYLAKTKLDVVFGRLYKSRDRGRIIEKESFAQIKFK